MTTYCQVEEEPAKQADPNDQVQPVAEPVDDDRDALAFLDERWAEDFTVGG